MSVDGKQICGLDTSLNLASQNYKWPMLDVTWTITGQLRTLSRESFKSAAEQAWQMWMVVCGIRMHYVDSPQQANILMGIQSIGPGGVLADSELPGPGTTANTQLRQRYDDQDDYVIAENPPGNKIDIVRVIAHEGAHALGVGHIAVGNLLAPQYNTKIRIPQTGDIYEMVARYGLPSAPPPPPSPPTGDYAEVVSLLEKGGQMFIRRNGVIRAL